MGHHKLPHHLRKARPTEKVHVSRVPSTVAADRGTNTRAVGQPDAKIAVRRLIWSSLSRPNFTAHGAPTALHAELSAIRLGPSACRDAAAAEDIHTPGPRQDPP
jgi:hypothetical protein